MNNLDGNRRTLDDLKALLDRLRGEDGCPWDRKQDARSIKIYLLEEAFELADALDRMVVEEIQEELGDLLFQILFLCHIFEEQGDFDLSRVLETIYQKMVRRHPHVFGQDHWENAEQVIKGWQEIKTREKKTPDPFTSIPINLPSLLKAHRISQRAAVLGFDWPHIKGVLEKVREEMEELEEAVEKDDLPAAREELGDLLFGLVNLGRFLGEPAENALRNTNQKFLRRFRTMLNDSPREGSNPARSLEEWERLWSRSKQSEKATEEEKQEKVNKQSQRMA
jgi:nucleoside triphosphate diphosphatase